MLNPLQIALLHWYDANQVPTVFNAGGYTIAAAFDGESIWVTNAGSDSNNVMKFRASDGTLLGTFPTGTADDPGKEPSGIAFDGANMWVTNQGSSVCRTGSNGKGIDDRDRLTGLCSL
jgi:DNA-binding beta-propeller fold protein YncE